jgi:hypothetical protein
VYGDHATMVTEEMDRVTIADAIEAPARTVDFSKQPFEERWGDKEEDARFLDAIVGAGERAVSGADAYATTVLLDRRYGLVAAERG